MSLGGQSVGVAGTAAPHAEPALGQLPFPWQSGTLRHTVYQNVPSVVQYQIREE